MLGSEPVGPHDGHAAWAHRDIEEAVGSAFSAATFVNKAEAIRACCRRTMGRLVGLAAAVTRMQRGPVPGDVLTQPRLLPEVELRGGDDPGGREAKASRPLLTD